MALLFADSQFDRKIKRKTELRDEEFQAHEQFAFFESRGGRIGKK